MKSEAGCFFRGTDKFIAIGMILCYNEFNRKTIKLSDINS